MARTVQECNDYIVTTLVNEFASVNITINPTLWSKTNVIRLLCYTVAIAQSLFEQLMDLQIARMEVIQRNSAAATANWLQDKVFKFQYSSTNPQYLVAVGGVLQYPVINPAYRIVTACAVSSTVTGTVNIKVAKGTPLGVLGGAELLALQNYVSMIGAAGVTYIASTSAGDKLYIKADIYYKGVYSSVIQANVETAINNYLNTLSIERFGGDIIMADLQSLVRAVEGVNDVYFDRVAVRYDSQSLFGGIDLVLDGDWINRKYTMGAGYLVEETTASNTFSDTLNYIAE